MKMQEAAPDRVVYVRPDPGGERPPAESREQRSGRRHIHPGPRGEPGQVSSEAGRALETPW